MTLGTRTYITRRRKKVTHNRETGLVHCEIQADIIATDTDRTPIPIAEPSLWSASPRVDCSFVQCLHVLNFPQTLNERPRHTDVVHAVTQLDYLYTRMRVWYYAHARAYGSRVGNPPSKILPTPLQSACRLSSGLHQSQLAQCLSRVLQCSLFCMQIIVREGYIAS